MSLNPKAVAMLCADPEWNRRVASVLQKCLELQAQKSAALAPPAIENHEPKPARVLETRCCHN